MRSSGEFRKTEQLLMPAEKPFSPQGVYDIYPVHETVPGTIMRGTGTLAEALAEHSIVALDGYTGVFFDTLRSELEKDLVKSGKEYKWLSTDSFMKDPVEIRKLKKPSCGSGDPLFGKKTSLKLIDLFDGSKLAGFKTSKKEYNFIVYGIGAALFADDAFLVWAEIPKNEIQYRSRAGSVTNIGEPEPYDPKRMYLEYYFCDWVILNEHKANLCSRIDIITDTQRPYDITWMRGDDLRKALKQVSCGAFRARPWFEPGAWGGTWLRDNIPALPKNVKNYAWSFELIAPENGLVLSSSGFLLEFSFDFIMYLEGENVLGKSFKKFGHEFPIRFDYLDTIGGGNLSLQCHPAENYIIEEFGESFAQDESYYIFENRDGSGVYLGLTDSTVKDHFIADAGKSGMEFTELDTRKYLQYHSSSRHDLFLIPRGTVHGSGKDNLVLEISSTPYIFTFKIYDWLRPDLDGKPRQLNIGRAAANINPAFSGEDIKRDFITTPKIISSGTDWELQLLPTHPLQFYSVKRYRFRSEITVQCNEQCLVLNLVEGVSVEVICSSVSSNFNFGETFIIPASAGSALIKNKSGTIAVLVIASVKEN